MNQIFKKKAVAVSVAALLISGAAAANQFEASTVDAVTKVNLLADNTTTRDLTITLNEQGSWSNTAARKVVVTLPASVRLNSTVAITGTTSATATNISAEIAPALGDNNSISYGGTSIVPSAATGYIDASGNTVITLTVAAANTTANDENLTLLFRVKSPVGSAAGDATVSVADSSTVPLNITAASVVPVSVVATPISASVASASTPTAGLSSQAAGDITLKFNAGYADGSLTNKTIDMVLGGGAKFARTPSVTEAIAGLAVTAQIVNDTTVRFTLDGAAAGVDAAVDNTITLDNTNGNYLDLSAVGAGAVTATLSSSGAGLITGFASQTVTVANAATKSVSVAYNDADGDGKVKTLYFGRSGASATISDKIKLAEGVTGSLVAGGTIKLSLPAGAKFVTGSEPTASIPTGGTLALVSTTATLNSAKTEATFTVQTGSSSAGSVLIQVPQVDLTDVATGSKLTVTIAGTAGVSGSADVANVATTGSASASGSLPVLTYGSTVTLPDLVLTEASVGAFNPGQIQLALPTGVTFDDVTSVTTTKTGGVTAVAVAKNNANGVNDAGVTVTLTGTSSDATGPSTVTIKGLKIKAAAATAANAPSTGDVVVQIAGSANPTTAGDLADATKFGANIGAGLSKQSFKLATIPGASSPVIPAATVTGAITSQSVSGAVIASGNDQGKPGTIYVAAIVDGTVFFRNAAGNWSVYTGVTPPAYATGTLGTNEYSVISSTDLSSLIGAQVVVGYGVGLPSLGNPFKDMIDNAKYNVVYTVKR